MRRVSSPPPGAFTLVELLGVLVVVALLAGLLLPALQKAMAEARKTKMIGNVRGAGIAIDTYRGEGGGAYPFSATIDAQNKPGRPYWTDAAAPYLAAPRTVRAYDGTTPKVSPSLLCPLVPGDRHGIVGDYGVNGAVCLRSVPAGGVAVRWASAFSPLPGVAVARPSQTALVMTAERIDVTPPAGNWWVGTQLYVGNPDYVQRPSDRGAGFVTCYFCDGHVAPVALKEMQTNAAHYLLPQ